MIRAELRKLLEEKTGALLLIAGGFLIVQIVAPAFPDSVGVTPPEGLPGWGSFIFSLGMLGLIGRALPFIALVGLYHRLTSETPRLAVVGGSLMALTPVLYSLGLLTVLLPPVPKLLYLLWLSPLPYILGTAFFGLAFFWKDGSVRFVGVPLLLFSGTWTLLYVLGLNSGDVPAWFPSAELLAISLVTMGYLLYATPTTRQGLYSDSPDQTDF